MIFKDKKLKTQWQQLNDEMEFEWIEGFDGMIQNRKFKQMAMMQVGEKEFNNLEKMLKNPLVGMLADFLDVYGLIGFYNNFEFSIFPGSEVSNTSDHSRKIYNVHIGLFFTKKYPFTFDIKKKGFFKKLFKRFFKNSINFPSHSDLGNTIDISSDDKASIEVFISDSKRLEALSKLYLESDDFVIDNMGIRFKTNAKILPKSELLPIMNAMIEFSTHF